MIHHIYAEKWYNEYLTTIYKWCYFTPGVYYKHILDERIYKKVNYPFHFSLQNLHLDKSILIFQQGKN